MQQVLSFYLDDRKRGMAVAGEGIFGRVVTVVQQAGWDVRYRGQSDDVGGEGHHLVYNRAVEGLRCLSLRRCYLQHYYRIEATNDRWDWQVAQTAFQAKAGSEWFQAYWRDRLFKGHEVRRDGYIFMPLQGKLLIRRHFQAQSPVDMIKTTLAADPKRRIVATLHPRESYSAAELAALQGIKRFELAEGGSMALLAGCDYVVTQNSSLALTGFFALKPAVLFARIDFHHLAGSVPAAGVDAAFAGVFADRPYARYLHWFFKRHALCEVGEDSAAQVAERLRSHGWPI